MAWTAAQQAARRQEAVDDHPGRQHVTTRCLHCSGFAYTGTLWEGQEILALHREYIHPELPSLEAARARSRRALRGTRKGLNTHTTRRENVSPEELQEREILRRMVRSDLPALEER